MFLNLKNDPSGKDCQTESTLCPKSKDYVWFACNKMGGEFVRLKYVSCYPSPFIIKTLEVIRHRLRAFGEISRMKAMRRRI